MKSPLKSLICKKRIENNYTESVFLQNEELCHHLILTRLWLSFDDICYEGIVDG